MSSPIHKMMFFILNFKSFICRQAQLRVAPRAALSAAPEPRLRRVSAIRLQSHNARGGGGHFVGSSHPVGEAVSGAGHGRHGSPMMRLGFPSASTGGADQRWEARIIRLAQAWQTSRTRCFGHTGYGSIGEGQPKPHPLSPPLAIGERPCRSGQGRRRPQNHASIPDPGEARDGRHCRIPLDYLFGRSIRVLDWHGLTEDRRR